MSITAEGIETVRAIMKRTIYIITKPDGEIYCAAGSEERAHQIVSEDCASGHLTCDGPLSPKEVNIEEIPLFA